MKDLVPIIDYNNEGNVKYILSVTLYRKKTKSHDINYHQLICRVLPIYNINGLGDRITQNKLIKIYAKFEYGHSDKLVSDFN